MPYKVVVDWQVTIRGTSVREVETEAEAVSGDIEWVDFNNFTKIIEDDYDFDIGEV